MLHYQNDQLYAGSVKLAALAAEFGTPLYVYDAADIRLRCRNLQAAFAELNPHIHYSVKANGNLAILRLLQEQGVGFDVVSGGELARLQAAGISAAGVGFAGVGKTGPEIEQALRAGIGFFNVESAAELARIAQIAGTVRLRAGALIRLNPNVDPKTHKYITTGQASNKFGLDFESAAAACDDFARHPWLDIGGFHMHLGSQIQQVEPYVLAVQKLLDFIAGRRAKGQRVKWLNIGGGFGIGYRDEACLSLPNLAEALAPLLRGQNLQLVLEPGRWLVARSGALLMEVQYVKQAGEKQFVIVDAGMHTLIRPALYGGWHKIWPVNRPETAQNLARCDVVGPICESADFLAQDRQLPPVQAGDILALFNAGAYGSVMASNYNSQPRPAEVLVDGDSYRLVRRRESYQTLIAPEVGL